MQKFSSTGTFLAKWGTKGSANGQFKNPYDLAIDAAGNVYVGDTSNNRVQKFDATGAFVTKWGTKGSANGQFKKPHGIATDATGNVYVADTPNNRVQKFRLDRHVPEQVRHQGHGERPVQESLGRRHRRQRQRLRRRHVQQPGPAVPVA